MHFIFVILDVIAIAADILTIYMFIESRIAKRSSRKTK